MDSKRVVITDLDNTLWDWVEIWYRSFSALLSELVALSGLAREDLESEIREVHQKHGTSEYAFLIEELPSLRRLHASEPLVEVYASAVEAYRQARRDSLALYPEVASTLGELARRGTVLVGYTESLAYYTNYRLRRTNLDSVLNYVYSPADHDLPRGLTTDEIRRYPKGHYQLARARHRNTPPGELKPNRRVLLNIISDIGFEPQDCVYVGDSKMKDITMAQDAGVADVWAAYGVAQHRAEYDLLRRVTHWTDSDVERERALMNRGKITPTYSVDRFGQLIDLFRFGSASKTD